MLKKLYIKNFALIEELQIEFAPGFNVITGETGTGKSLVVNALNSILGEKIPFDALRKGAERAIIEGLFVDYPEEIEKILQENELELFDKELILRREMSQAGRSRTLINDCVTQISLLKEISDRLVDLHGQHEHQSLLREESHLSYLDAYAGLEDLLRPVRALYAEIKKLTEELENLHKNARQLREKQDYLEFQIREIEALKLYPEEEEELLHEERILANHEKLMTLCNEIYTLLYDSENAAYPEMSIAAEKMQELAHIDPNFKETLELLMDALVNVEEVSRAVSEYVNATDYDPERLEEIRTRLGQLSRLKKKYGVPIAEILQKLEEMKKELAQIENLDERLIAVEKAIAGKKEELLNLAQQLSVQRKKAAGAMEKEIESVLAQIGMGNARFRIQFERYDPEEDGGILLDESLVAKRNGIDKVRFLVSTNPGEDFKPLARIASGGEISRVMLALKSTMAEKDRIGVLVFDEIDIGISGRIAEAVGRKLKELSRSHQIICVTHLPQIASFADKHFSVRKEVKNGETFTFMHELSREERIKEIAYLLGGERITDTVLRSAEEMISASESM